MHTPRRAAALAVAGLGSLILAALLFQIPRSGTPAPLQAAQEPADQLEVDPDTMVGWGIGPAQPILFSHRRHAGAFQIDCLYCHSNADRSPYAMMPPVDVCMGCHTVVKSGSPEIEKLRGYREEQTPIPWVRIYKVADFVQFNHAPHVRSDLECQNCHGNVEETDVLYQVQPLTMGWCLDCHRQPASPEARAQAEAVARGFAATGRESHGLYPRSIDSHYGVTRAPIDCAACHY